MSLFKRRGSPYWQTEIQVSGRRLIRSTGTTSRREAEAFERRLRESARREAPAGDGSSGNDPTVDQLAGRYWTSHGSELRWAANVAAYLKRIVAVLGPIKLSELGSADCSSLLEQLKAEGMGPVSINRCLAVLRGAHSLAGKRWGLRTQLIDWRVLRTPETKERIRWSTRDEAARLVGGCPAHIGLIVEWSLYTGLRKRETLNLLRTDFDPARGSVQVVVKGGAKRVLELSPAALDVIARAPLLPNGRLFDGTNLRKLFYRATEAPGLTDFHFHDLRHTFATWLRQGGSPLEVVSRALGHSSIHVTQRYAHVDDRELRAATASIGVLTPSNLVHLESARRRKKSRHVGGLTER
jgi:integrase